jgi:hypothetical protein
LLLPEGGDEGWRPPIRESPTEGLDPLSRASRQQAAWEEQVRTGTEREGISLRLQEAELAEHVHHWHLHLAHGPDRRDDDKDKRDDDKDKSSLQSVQAELGRPLTPEELIMSRTLIRQGKSAAEITAILRRI